MDPGAQTKADRFKATLPASEYLSATIAGEALSEAPRTAPAWEAPHLRGASLEQRVEPLRQAGSGHSDRFEVTGLLGNGATGLVYAAHDRNLARDVAVKVLKAAPSEHDEVVNFVDEARTTAGLDHPNVMPIHEIDVTEAGQLYFTMKKIEGRSLGEAITQSSHERREETLAVGRVVSVAIALGQAIGYAHHRGVIHQDLKPDNVMLGSFGEIILVDWGSATRADAPQQRLYGTPLYMAPEQARRERVDARSDLYCLGATLFHALTLRVPTWHDDAEEFWRRKRTGEIDPITDTEHRSIPAPLLAITLKALAPRPEDRYQKAEDLVRDLERFQNGLSVLAHHETWLEILARWHRQHARMLWLGTASLIAITALGAVLYGERLKQLATWGEPIISESFADDDWRERWTIASGGFERRDGAMVSTAGWDSMLDLKQRLEGDTAITYTAEVLPGMIAGDLSVFWFEDRNPSHADTGRGLYKVQVGAFGNSYTAITGEGTTHYAYSDFHFEVGRRYQIRVEIQGAAVRLVIDGRKQCEYVERQPFHGGYLSLYAFGIGHAFSDVRVYEREVARQVPATAIGDAFLRNRQYRLARAEYRRIATSHPGTAMARESTFKQGLCLMLDAGSDASAIQEADALWKTLRGSEWDDEIALRRLEHRFDSGDRAGAADDLEAAYRRAPPEAKARVVIAWTRMTNEITRDARRMWDGALIERYLSLHERLFPNAPITDRAMCEALLTAGHYQEVLDRYPKQDYSGTMALLWMGHPEQVLDRYQGGSFLRLEALAAMGRTGEIPTLDPSEDPLMNQGIERGLVDLIYAKDPHAFVALVGLGRFEEILADPKMDAAQRRLALLQLGRADEITDPIEMNAPGVLLAKGRIDDAMRLYQGNFSYGGWVRIGAGLEEFIAGNRQRALSLFDIEPRAEFHQNMSTFPLLHYVMVPFLRELAGERGALTAMSTEVLATRRWAYQQIPWYNASYLLGRIDEAGFLAQPMCYYCADDLAFCQGVRAELGGDSPEAVRAYQRYLAVPRYRRNFDFESVSERFVLWRLQELKRSSR